MTTKLLTSLLLISTFMLSSCGVMGDKRVEFDILMPNVSPQTKDTYLCHQVVLDDKNPVYITEFQPKSTKQIAHHILLFGCDGEAERDLWNCGEMGGNGQQEKIQYETGPVCNGRKQSIIYAWAMDAPKLTLPKDVAFKIGGNTDIKYLVLQVHYANVDDFIAGKKDTSGLVLIGQNEPLKYEAGVYLLETGGYIKQHTMDAFDSACEYKSNQVMHPFAYRTHTHKLGVVNSGYVIKTNPSTGEQQWTEIGRRSPQLPQMFYPVSNTVTINKGDILAARCTMENPRDNDVKVGPTGDDEMCNFYIMYYMDGEDKHENNVCVRAGPPYWYFEQFKTSRGKRLNTHKIPNDISQVPEDQVKELSDSTNHHDMMMNMANNKQNNNDDDDSKNINEELYNLINMLNADLESEDDDNQRYNNDDEDLLLANYLRNH